MTAEEGEGHEKMNIWAKKMRMSMRGGENKSE